MCCLHRGVTSGTVALSAEAIPLHGQPPAATLPTTGKAARQGREANSCGQVARSEHNNGCKAVAAERLQEFVHFMVSIDRDGRPAKAQKANGAAVRSLGFREHCGFAAPAPWGPSSIGRHHTQSSYIYSLHLFYLRGTRPSPRWFRSFLMVART